MTTKNQPADPRPNTYWDYENPLQAVLAKVSGQARREMITDFWNAGILDEMDAELLRDELKPAVRESLGRIHPFFMGGEYLEPYLPDEVAIVHLGLMSTTFDVIELRARRLSEDRIALRWVDEYGTEFSQPDDEISEPFSLEELIDFIEKSRDENNGGCLPLCYSQSNADCLGEVDSLANFTSLSSDFYPGLEDWFNKLNAEWLASFDDGEEEEYEDTEEEVA